MKPLQKSMIEYKEFSLADLEINSERFLSELEPSFDDLVPDSYDVDQEKSRYNVEKPFRERRYSAFEMEKDKNDEWKIQVLPPAEYAQDVNDVRAIPRTFAPLSDQVRENESFQSLLKKLASILAEQRELVKKVLIQCHQIRIQLSAEGESSVESEPLHKEGKDFYLIIPALVMARQHFRGAISLCTDTEENDMREIELQPGQGTMVNDRTRMHGVTDFSVDPSSPDGRGHRDFFGFDMKILS